MGQRAEERGEGDEVEGGGMGNGEERGDRMEVRSREDMRAWKGKWG